jgi:hypothetical protein
MDFFNNGMRGCDEKRRKCCSGAGWEKFRSSLIPNNRGYGKELQTKLNQACMEYSELRSMKKKALRAPTFVFVDPPRPSADPPRKRAQRAQRAQQDQQDQQTGGNAWNAFQKANHGSGKTQRELSVEYKRQKVQRAGALPLQWTQDDEAYYQMKLLNPNNILTGEALKKSAREWVIKEKAGKKEAYDQAPQWGSGHNQDFVTLYDSGFGPDEVNMLKYYPNDIKTVINTLGQKGKPIFEKLARQPNWLSLYEEWMNQYESELPPL